MTQAYSFLEDIALADMAFEAKGDTAAELFQAAALALSEGMADIRRVRPKIHKTIRLRHARIDQLLFDWLAELIYLKDAERILFGRFSVQLAQNEVWELTANIQGESISPKHHDLRSDVKAVTYHLFEVGQSESGEWKARVVLDI